MSTNTENINYNEFENICRICVSPCDMKFTEDSVILNVYYKLTDIHFKANDKLPQQICLKCFKKINEIHEFAVQCNEAYSRLTKCLDDFLNEFQNVTENFETINISKLELEIKEEIIIDEHETELFNDEELYSTINDTNNGSNIYVKNKEESMNNSRVESDSIEMIIDKNQYKCDVCNKTFRYLRSFKKHQIKPNCGRCYKCKECSKLFTRPSHLNRHTQMHSGECPFKCGECGKSFKRSKQLEAHTRIHSDESIYNCLQCSISFTRLSARNRHMRTHTGKLPYKCEKCQKFFNRSEYLKKHLCTHSGEQPE